MKVIANSSITTNAKEVRELIDTFSSDITILQSLVNESIPNYWKGNDATAFIKKFNEEVFPELEKYRKSFKEYQTYLSKVYSVFSNLEEDYDKNIN